MSQNEEKWLTVEEIAKDLRVSTGSIRRAIARKELISHKVGHLDRISRKDYLDYLDLIRSKGEEEA